MSELLCWLSLPIVLSLRSRRSEATAGCLTRNAARFLPSVLPTVPKSRILRRRSLFAVCDVRYAFVP